MGRTPNPEDITIHIPSFVGEADGVTLIRLNDTNDDDDHIVDGTAHSYDRIFFFFLYLLTFVLVLFSLATLLHNTMLHYQIFSFTLYKCIVLSTT